MKKVKVLMMCLIVSTSLTYSEKFQSFTLSNRYVCLPYEQMDKLIESHKLVKNFETQNSVLVNQLNLLEKEHKTYKQKHIKVFLFGVAAGAGVTLIGVIAVVVNQMF